MKIIAEHSLSSFVYKSTQHFQTHYHSSFSLWLNEEREWSAMTRVIREKRREQNNNRWRTSVEIKCIDLKWDKVVVVDAIFLSFSTNSNKQNPDTNNEKQMTNILSHFVTHKTPYAVANKNKLKKAKEYLANCSNVNPRDFIWKWSNMKH